MKKFITFEEFAAAKAKKTQVQLEQELSTKRDAAANSFKKLLSEFGVASIKELSEEDRPKFNEKLGALTESALLLESTNSQLGKIDKRGRIKSVYVHSEGYPEYMVPVIKKYDKKGVDQLLKLGSSGISFLDKKIGKKQNFDSPVSGTTLFYGRDRGEHYDMTTKWNDAADLKGYFNEVKDSGAEYVYLYDERDGNWYMGKPFNGDDKLQLVESKVSEGINDFGGMGLIVKGKSKKDNDLIDQATEESGFYGIYDPQDNYWFFPEKGDLATVDKLENELETILMKKGANVRYEVQYESVVTEAEIKSDDEFKEYAFTVLKKAFSADFDEAKAQEVVDGILGKVDGDYGKAAGILQSSLD